jgi:hypothetical protein
MNQYNKNIINEINLERLSEFIKDNYQIETTFSVEGVSDSGFEIISTDLLSQTGNIGGLLFSKIYLRLGFSKNSILEIEESVDKLKYIPIGFRYDHHFGGSNGVDLGRGWIAYNFKTQKWVME